MHSWTIPRLGVKADATPGRLNQTRFLINWPGLFYGHCSEICGANHSFMPIVIERISTNKFTNWISRINEYSSDDWKQVKEVEKVGKRRTWSTQLLDNLMNKRRYWE